MGAAFNQETPILNFRPKAHLKGISSKSKKYLLWPTLAYQVVAPKFRQRKLNLLQKAVLGLCRAGCYRSHEISPKLEIHENLAKFILEELSGRGWLNYDGLPSEKGIEVLEEEMSDSHELVVGYVFQDPWNGKLWPRFVEKLDYIELDFPKEDGFPQLKIGTKGDPKPKEAFMHFPNSVSNKLDRPYARDIILAVKQYHRELNSFTSRNNDEFIETEFLSEEKIKSVAFIDEKPSPFFLMTFMYVPDSNAVSETGWFVCDPFGMGANRLLKDRIEKETKSSQHLLERVDELLGSVLRINLKQYRECLENIEEKAKEKIEKRFGINIRSCKAYENLVKMESFSQTLESLDENQKKNHIESIFLASRKVLESTFIQLSENYSLKGGWRKLYSEQYDNKQKKQVLKPIPDKNYIQEKYKIAAVAVGFEETKIPNRFLNIKAEDIKSVSDYTNSWKLGALVTATLLKSSIEEGHPLRSVAKNYSELLVDIDEIAEISGESSHYQQSNHKNKTRIDTEKAKEIVEKVYKIVCEFMNIH